MPAFQVSTLSPKPFPRNPYSATKALDCLLRREILWKFVFWFGGGIYVIIAQS